MARRRHLHGSRQTEEARFHLGRCEFCQGLLQMYEEFSTKAEQLKSARRGAQGDQTVPQSPPGGEWP